MPDLIRNLINIDVMPDLIRHLILPVGLSRGAPDLI